VNKTYADCGHVCCFKCLKNWSQYNKVCPVCNTEFSEIIHTDPIKRKSKLKSFFKKAGLITFGVTGTVVIVPVSLVMSPIVVIYKWCKAIKENIKSQVSEKERMKQELNM